MNSSLSSTKAVYSYGIFESILAHDIWWFLSWGLTLARFPLLLVCLTQIYLHSAFIVLSIFAIVIFDILDGKLMTFSSSNSIKAARSIRHVFDALGDRIVIFSVLTFSLLFLTLNPLFYFIIVFREIILTYIVFRIYINHSLIVKANTVSKIGTVCVAIIVLNAATPILPQFIPVLSFISFSLLGIYLYSYHYEEC